jgi:hypothetical protein
MYFQKVKIQNIYLGCLEATYEKSWIRILSPIRICICNSSVLKWQRSTTLLKLSPLCHCIKYPISVKKWYIWEYLASIQLKEMTNYVSTLQASELLIVGHQTNKLIGKNIFSFFLHFLRYIYWIYDSGPGTQFHPHSDISELIECHLKKILVLKVVTCGISHLSYIYSV